ncbi:hypothetical protein BpHYR1_022668 [Brachionus plicatilis]|uniref:Uncharacterized protein n=1 Tax=Brachionus plicatilis TaxID=10195 RepID=A0A3M7SJX8_BRAPC|nr:hypothetical protein BpHYR1_022668 [Brachionus plicatilis]
MILYSFNTIDHLIFFLKIGKKCEDIWTVAKVGRYIENNKSIHEFINIEIKSNYSENLLNERPVGDTKNEQHSNFLNLNTCSYRVAITILLFHLFKTKSRMVICRV